MADKPLSLDQYVQSEDDLTKYVIEPLGMQTKTPDQRTFYQKAAQGATQAIEGQGGPAAGMLASFVIPQNEAELGMMAGTAGAQGLVNKLGMTGGKAALARILGAAGGGEAGGQLGGQQTGAGAVTGGIAGLTGETAMPMAGWLTRSVGGMPARINRQRSEAIGNVIQERVPALAGAKDARNLSDFARSFEEGKGPLLEAYSKATDELEKKLGGRNLNIPELGGGGIQDVYNPNAGVTIRQVMDELKKAGHYGYGGDKSNPNVRTIVGEEPRMEYGALLKKTQDELNRLDPSGELAKEFMDNRGTAAAGFTFLKALGGKNAFRRGSQTQVNIPYLQEYVDKNQTEIQKKIGPSAWAKLQEVLWPGGGHSSLRDIPGPYMPESSDVAMEALRGTGGSPRIFSLIPRLVAPGIGSQYAGRAPFTPSGGTRAVTDMMLQRVLAPFLRQEEPQ